MSEAAAERPTQQRPRTAGAPGTESVFTRKFGPLPGWGWAAVAAAAAIGYWWYRNHSGAAAATAAASQGTAADTSTATGDDVQGELSTIQTEIQDLQGEESSEGSSTGGTTGSKKYTRHVSTGKETLNQIAKADSTSVAHIVSVSRAAPENKANLEKLLDWASKPGSRRKGIVYYTS